jgi:protein SCO1/2
MAGSLRNATRLAALLIVLGSVAACARPASEPVKRYPLQGQVLSVNPAKQEINIKHGDIPGFMPGMQMIYPVASPQLMEGRAPGELVDAVLEVRNATGRLVEITHKGMAPLPDNPNASAMASGVLDVGDEAPDAAFIDQANTRRSFADWRGTPTVLTFIYTRCPLPNFCPLMSQNFATLQRRLADDTSLHGRVRLVTISFDPDHDTPEVLAAQAAKLKADASVWTFLTGDRATVERFAGKFGVSLLRDPGDPVQITHNLRTFLIGADGRIVRIYTGSDWTVADVLADLRKVVAN